MVLTRIKTPFCVSLMKAFCRGVIAPDKSLPGRTVNGDGFARAHVARPLLRLPFMANPKEPQSYGRRERSAPEQGGKVSPAQIEENVQPGAPSATGGDASPRNVSTRTGGAKRGSYFRDRDYK
jgi:hypothetical protein